MLSAPRERVAHRPGTPGLPESASKPMALPSDRSRSYLILDIETVADPDLSWDSAKDGFAPAPFHRVVALGVLWLDGDLKYQRMGVFGEAGTPEEDVLTQFTTFVGRRHPHIVTFNGRSFDLPVLVNRCLRHGVSFHAYYADTNYRYRYSDYGHIDIADFLTDYGASRKLRLDSVAKLVGMPGKMDVDGSMVATMFEQGRVEEIRTYCLQDVIQTAFVLLRVELLRGQIDRDGYRQRAIELWTALETDERAKPVLVAADRKRVLLET